MSEFTNIFKNCIYFGSIILIIIVFFNICKKFSHATNQSRNNIKSSLLTIQFKNKSITKVLLTILFYFIMFYNLYIDDLYEIKKRLFILNYSI